MNTKYFIILMLAFTATACSHSDNTEVSNTETPVNFTTVVNSATGEELLSRAANAAWDAGDQIGIFMVEHDATAISENAENRQFVTATGNGDFAPATTAHTIYYPMDDSAVDFIAYYPYAAGTTLDNAIAIDATNPAFDLLYTTANNTQEDGSAAGYTKSFGQAGGKVAFTFYHKMSKLIMKVAGDDAVGTINEMDVTIKGMKTQGTFNLATGEFGSATVGSNYAPLTVTDKEQYSAFVIPASYTAGELQIVFTINKNTKVEDFIWTVDALEFVSGKYHTYNVTLNRTNMTATGSIVEWENGGESNVGVN